MAIEKIICPVCKGTEFRPVKADIVCQNCGYKLTDKDIHKTLQESYKQYKREGLR